MIERKIKNKRNETPLADFLLTNQKLLLANFHALPIAAMNSGMEGYDKYSALFGQKYFSTETTVTGKVFDSFFTPQNA